MMVMMVMSPAAETLRMPICYKAAAIGQSLIDGQEVHLANIFRGRIEYELIYSLRGAKHRVDYSVHIR